MVMHHIDPLDRFTPEHFRILKRQDGSGHHFEEPAKTGSSF